MSRVTGRESRMTGNDPCGPCRVLSSDRGVDEGQRLEGTSIVRSLGTWCDGGEKSLNFNFHIKWKSRGEL